MGRTIKEVQQDFANNSGFRNETIWDHLSKGQYQILKDKLKQLIPDQDNGQKAIEELRENLFNNIWAQRKYTNRNSLTAFIYVLVTEETDFNIADQSKAFSCHPVIRARKCVAEGDSSQCCMIFVDETGRVYQNWDSYKADNVLPKGTMVAPQGGVYTFDKHNIVRLDKYATPASSGIRTALAVADGASIASGVFGVCVPVAALLSLPVAAPIFAAAAVAGLTSAGYSVFRSGTHLADRNQHEQSISLLDRQARTSWLGVAGGLIGLGAAGATRALTAAATAGREISLVTELVVNGINISSIVLSGTGLANGILDVILKYHDKEQISYLEIVQLSASLVLFTHSINNFRLASNIVTEMQNGSIQSYRDTLSNRQRRMFDKMTKETLRIRGETRGKVDIIRSVNDIPNRQYLNDLHKINKNLNRQNVRPAFGTAGEGVVLNNDLPVDTQTLRNSVQHNIGPDVLGQVTQPIPQSHSEAPVRSFRGSQHQTAQIIYANSLPDDSGEHNSLISGVRLAEGVKTALSDFGGFLFENIVNAESFEDVITTMARIFNEDSFRFLVQLAKTFIDKQRNYIHTLLQTFISTESILYQILKHCVENYSETTYEFLHTKGEEIMEAVKAYFLTLNPNNYPDLLQKCPVCSGHYALCAL